MSQAKERSREAFETWALENGYITEEKLRCEDGTYFNAGAESRWICWQAAEDAGWNAALEALEDEIDAWIEKNGRPDNFNELDARIDSLRK